MTSKERHYAKFKRKAFVVRSIAEISDRTESGADMKKVLGWPELLFLGIGCILGAGIVVLTGVAARKYAGPAVVLSYLMSAVAALLTSFCYAEFAADLPVVGGAFNYVGLTFGEFAAWVAACDLILEYTLSAAAVAKGFTAYFAQLIGVNLSRLRLQASIFTLDFPALLAVVVASLVLARSTRESSLLNSVVVALHLLLVIFVFAAGFPHVKEENYHPFMPFGIRGCFTGASVVFFSYVGFDTVATAAEEVKHPGRDLPIGIVGSLSICTVFYVLMCIVISGMQPYTEIDLHAPFSVAFQAVGLDWADKIIAGGAITGIVTSLLGSLLGQARIYVTLGRQHLLPKWLAQVDAASGTPRNATYLTMFTAGILALFLDIEVLSELVSIGALVVFTMVCAGVLFRRYHVRGLGDSARPVGLRLVGIALTSIAFSLSFTERAPLLLPLFFLLAWLAITLSFYRLPVLYTPTLFKCPGSPWVPSLGMLTCLHLIGSLGWPAYVRWIVWFALGTVVYVTYSMHHSQGEGKGSKPPGSEGGSVSAGSSPLLLDRHSHSSDPGNATQLTLSPWLHTGLTQDDGSSVSKGRGRDSGGGLGDGNGGVGVNGMGARAGGGLGSGTVELQARPGAAGPGH
ncbi:amino acid permease-domain-containing protein [Haematococcus lacustris]